MAADIADRASLMVLAVHQRSLLYFWRLRGSMRHRFPVQSSAVYFELCFCKKKQCKLCIDYRDTPILHSSLEGTTEVPLGNKGCRGPLVQDLIIPFICSAVMLARRNLQRKEVLLGKACCIAGKVVTWCAFRLKISGLCISFVDCKQSREHAMIPAGSLLA